MHILSRSVFTAVYAVATLMVSSATFAAEKTYTLEAGQVIDFLFLTRRPNSEEALKAYARDAIAEARALDYKGLGGFSLTRRPTQGNYFPESLIMGAWPGDFKDRADALDSLLEAVPDLYQRRLDIWSRFDMTNYELKEDKSFTVDTDKIQILTAYWLKDEEGFERFKAKFLSTAWSTGADIKLELTDGRSPFGYEYVPHYTVLAEWDTQAEFDRFLEANLAMDHSSVRHVNQFYLTPPKPKS